MKRLMLGRAESCTAGLLVVFHHLARLLVLDTGRLDALEDAHHLHPLTLVSVL